MVSPVRNLTQQGLRLVQRASQPASHPVATLRTAQQSLDIFWRSGLLGPYPPWKLARATAAMARYGLRLGAVYAIGEALHGDAPAIIDDRGQVGFATMQANTDTIAAGLAERGVHAGDQVAVLCRNHRHFVATTVALSKLGADIIYLNTGFAGPQLAEVTKREEAKALILDEEFLPIAASLDIPRVVAWTDTDAVAEREDTFDDLLADGPKDAPPKPPRESRQIILTSGTTGTPKGAQRNTGGEAEPLVALLSRIPYKTSDVTLMAAPMFHSWGLANTGLALLFGARIIAARKFDPEDTLALIDKHRVTVLVAVPVMIQRIMALPDRVFARYDTSSLRIVGLSGSALPGDLANRCMDRFGDVVYNLYGSTEIGWASIATPEDLRAAPGTAGRVPLGAELRILDDTGSEQAVGETGRIFVRSGLLFEGYTGGGSKDVIDGFMSTGDVGHLDAAGHLFVDGRDDDMIVSGGENVFPREVEDLLADHEGVVDVAVLGVDDDQYGQRLKAFVVRAPGADVDEETLKDHVRAHLARYKVPGEIVFRDDLPRNATGKIVKRELE
ncbi:MAG: AMP-binding protein [Acidimicrobiales bacterium]